MAWSQDRSQGRFAGTLEAGGKTYAYFPVASMDPQRRLPYSLTVLLENALRCASSDEEAEAYARRIIDAGESGQVGREIEFMPARVLFQDFTGVPVFVDFAAMREACLSLGGDPRKINPQIPCDLVIDHSVIADSAGCASALERNQEKEYHRNRERYEFLRWAQGSFENVRIVPPGAGICHQLNIENLASVVFAKDGIAGETGGAAPGEGLPLAYFDTVVGTDSHTPTANGIGVLGWGVGGIEAEAAALGQPITTLVPPVIGIRVVGSLSEGVSAMDVALSFAEALRKKNVVRYFVECFGPGIESLTPTMRACIANMTPEYGCTCTLFPVDAQTCDYLRVTGRTEEQCALVEAYAKAQGLWLDPAAPERHYSEVIEFDLSAVKRSIAGPSRPHDRIDLAAARDRFHEVCAERGLDLSKRVTVDLPQGACEIGHGALAIAAVTSCTTATDPAMMLRAGLIARNAAARGLRPKPWVKCVLAPGSKATALLLERAGLVDGLRQLGFYNCGFGCMSCIGNSGPVLPGVHDVAGQVELASVLSGNRNFAGRISPDVSQNYLAAPAVVIAYALAGTMDVDLENDALGIGADGAPVHLADIWPDEGEVADLTARFVDASLYREGSAGLFDGDGRWRALGGDPSDTFAWDEGSTYVRRPPYFDGMTREAQDPAPIEDARILAYLGDFITTDHISPAGSIAPDSPAARYLEERGVAPADFNTYGARRGNHEVMMRGTFANVKLENKLAEGRVGGWTRNFLDGAIEPVFDASRAYAREGIGQVILAGDMYGSGSSRDWAAKGPMLLGVRAVIANGYERIHLSNLIGMGVLPLQPIGTVESLGLDGSELISVDPIDFSNGMPEPNIVNVRARRADGSVREFKATVLISTPTEGRYYANGGILPYVLRQLVG